MTNSFEKLRKKIETLYCAENNFLLQIDESTNIISLITDLNGRILRFNKKCEEITKYRKEDVIGEYVWDIVVPLDKRNYLKKNFLQVKEENKCLNKVQKNKECEWVTKSGEKLSIYCSSSVIKDSNGKLIAFVIRGSDITEQKSCEDSLNESNEKYKMIFDNANDMIIYLDKKGDIVDINKRIEDVFGYDRSDVIGRNIKDLRSIDTENKVLLLAQFKNIFNIKKTSLIKASAKSKAGRKFNIEISSRAIKRDGKIIGVLAIIRDITARHRLQKKLSESLEFTQKILDELPVSIVVTDKKGKILMTNNYYDQITGYLGHSRVGYNLLKSKGLGNYPDVLTNYQKLLEGGQAFVNNDLKFKYDGKVYFLNLHAVPYYNVKGKIDGIISIGKDVTKLVKAKNKVEEMNQTLEEKVKDRTERLKKAVDSKTEFLADASHELRTPLTIIQGNLDLLMRPIENERRKAPEEINIIYDEVKNMSGLISELMLLSRLDVSVEGVDVEKINLYKLITSIYDNLKILAKQKNIGFQLSIKKDVCVDADKRKIEKVIYNVISNAIRYGKKDGWVKIDAIEENNGVKIIIEDNGVGIAEKDLEHIFKRFYRVDKERSRETGGTGLGLAIVKYIVELHKGDLKVESKLGKGTKFMVFLPSLS